MDKDVYDRGLSMRRKVLGEEYVDRALKSADDFNCDFQRIVTQYCWGEAWGDDTLSPRERSILNLGMIASLGRMEEFQTHVRGALNNGMTPNEIRALYEQRFEAYAATVRQLALSAGCDYRRVSTSTPYLQTLGTFLVQRAG